MGRGKKIVDTAVVIDAAVELIESHGFEEFSTRRLAAALHISAMTLYNYYENRGAILRDVVNRGFQALWQELPDKLAAVELRGENPLRSYLCLAEHLLSFAQARPRLYRFLFEADLGAIQRDERISARYREAFARVESRIADAALAQQIHRDVYLYLVLVNALAMNVLTGRSGMTAERFRDYAASAYESLLARHESGVAP